MFLLESLRVALGALRANLLRSFLTTLGIIMGVAAVIAVVSVIQGLEFLIVGQLRDVGASFMLVTPHSEPRQAPGQVVRQVKLTWEDGEALRRSVPGIDLISPVILGRPQVKYRERNHTPQFVLGVNQDFPEVNNFFVERGRFFSGIDLRHRRKVAVVGTEVVDDLELGPDPLGKEIYVGNIPVTIIGIMEKKGQSLGQNLDDLVFVPFDTALSIFGRSAGDQVQLRIQAASTDVVEEVKDGIRRVLRQRHGLARGEPDDFQITTQDDILETIGTVTRTLSLGAVAVVGVALLVGGIGIMNIMLVSVTERTREIGIRKAVGARRQDILWQFLIEAVTLSLLGGLIGLGMGYGLGAVLTHVLPGDLPPPHVPLVVVILALLSSSIVGVGFGIYPAARASFLDPIEALRYE